MNKPDPSGKTKSRISEEGLEDKSLEKRIKPPCPVGNAEAGQSQARMKFTVLGVLFLRGKFNISFASV